jgi:hypothetical protein
MQGPKAFTHERAGVAPDAPGTSTCCPLQTSARTSIASAVPYAQGIDLQ